jgi:signal recognition particle subunit SRP72
VEALDSIAELNTKQLQFEKAYCFYKTNQLEKSLETIENETDERFCLLKAQVLYRLDRFEECLEVYSKLPDEEDIETNRKACLALMNNGTTTSTTSNSFATIFNIGCMYANQQKYRLAEQKFIEAMEICRQDMIQEGASENEIEKEVAVIMAQQGFIQQCQGSNQNALATYRSVLASGYSSFNSESKILSLLPLQIIILQHFKKAIF